VLLAFFINGVSNNSDATGLSSGSFLTHALTKHQKFSDNFFFDFIIG
jgi:hypothetical protein